MNRHSFVIWSAALLAAGFAAYGCSAGESSAATDRSVVVAPGLSVFDANGDGVITLEEFLRRPQQDFAALDRNGDHVLSVQEFPMRSVVAFQNAGGNSKDASSQAEGVRGAALFSATSSRSAQQSSAAVSASPNNAVSLDLDGDGVVRLDEFLAPWNAVFKDLDTDGSGVLSRDELAPHLVREAVAH